MIQNPSNSKKEEIEGLGWREFASTCRRSLRLCMEGSGNSFVLLVVVSLLSSFQPAAMAATAGLIVSRVEKMLTSDQSDPWVLTPNGAGARFDPPKYLKDGDVVEVEVSGIGVLRNTVKAELLT